MRLLVRLSAFFGSPKSLHFLENNLTGFLFPHGFSSKTPFMKPFWAWLIDISVKKLYVLFLQSLDCASVLLSWSYLIFSSLSQDIHITIAYFCFSRRSSIVKLTSCTNPCSILSGLSSSRLLKSFQFPAGPFALGSPMTSPRCEWRLI